MKERLPLEQVRAVCSRYLAEISAFVRLRSIERGEASNESGCCLERLNQMAEEKVNIETADGNCDCYIYGAPGDVPAPAVILYMDGFGIRPGLREMAQRIASNGYSVLLPNMYYRAGEQPPINPSTALTDPAQQKHLMELV